WIRRKIETENLSGLGPPALLLRTEDRGLNDELDQLGREEDVRAVVEDFNRRVIEARRQLAGGPPVVTKTRDADAEVAAWQERRRSARSAVEVDDGPREKPDADRRRGVRGWLRRWRGQLGPTAAKAAAAGSPRTLSPAGGSPLSGARHGTCAARRRSRGG